jgi:hypothetical protein
MSDLGVTSGPGLFVYLRIASQDHKIKNMKKDAKKKKAAFEDEKFPLPIYSADEDIYKKEKEQSFDEEDEDKLIKGKTGKNLGPDLDIPGSELDDGDEEIGEEDEENNYYSLGGDDHNDLEEDKEEDR